MTTCSSHETTRCWACGGATDAPVRGLCLECYTLLQQPGRIGHAFVEGPTALPPFVLPLRLAPGPAAATAAP